MQKSVALALSTLAILAAGSAHADVRYVPVPFIGPGSVGVLVEYSRDKGSPVNDVDVTYIPENVSGVNLPVVHQKVYIGPSTSTTYPLLDITPNAPGLVVVDSEAGLTPDEVALEAGTKLAGTGWELPLLTPGTAFAAGKTAYVLNMTKSGASSTNLSIYNLGTAAATCSFKILRPKGTPIEQRTGISVPALGTKRFDDALRLAGNASRIVGAVTCNQPFYAMGALPNEDRTRVRVNYPIAAFPVAGAAVTMMDKKGQFLNCLPDFSYVRFPLPFALSGNSGPGPRYKTFTVDFDVKTGDPEYVVIRNIVGMLRSGGRRFGKTLFFGSFDRPQASGGAKMLVDLGTPYIETVVKRNADLTGLQNLHFHIELDSEQRTMLYQITRSSSGLSLFSVTTGFFNEDLNAVGDAVPVLEFGLPGVADDAYFPPYRWKFLNLKVVATK
jgi:hypothetical protein